MRQSVQQIDTRNLGPVQETEAPIYVTEGSHHSKNSNSRIEVVEWQNSDNSADQNFSSSSDSLSTLMVPANVDKSVDKLTIDNLWKILACEKPGEG